MDFRCVRTADQSEQSGQRPALLFLLDWIQKDCFALRNRKSRSRDQMRIAFAPWIFGVYALQIRASSQGNALLYFFTRLIEKQHANLHTNATAYVGVAYPQIKPKAEHKYARLSTSAYMGISSSSPYLPSYTLRFPTIPTRSSLEISATLPVNISYMVYVS